MTKTKVSDKDIELMKQMAAEYHSAIKSAFNDHPEWKDALKHLPTSTIVYYLVKFKTKKKQITKSPARREEVREIQVLPSIASLTSPFHCVGCGRNLTNIINTVLLEQSTQI